MKIATWNVNGIRARQEQFLDWIAGEQPDVVCLQELKARPDQLAAELCELGGYHCFWHGSGPQSGVSIHVRREYHEVEPVYGHPPFDRQTRLVEATLGDLVVTSMYLPNGGKDYDDKLLFLQQFREWIAARKQETDLYVVCGDMNVTRGPIDVHPTERSFKAVGQREDERLLFEAVLKEGLVDVARQLHPDDPDFFTWWAPWREHKARNIGWRIDYILASPALAKLTRACYVQRAIGASDHGPLIAEFDL